MTKKSDNPLVYSTNPAPRVSTHSESSKNSPTTAGKKVARLSIERKGRGGKTVTLVVGLQGNSTQIAELASQLKKSCGSGGTIKDDIVEIQGDHRPALAVKLRSLGYDVKGV